MSRRPLTPGEIAMARLVFGESIRYDSVRVNRRSTLLAGPVHHAMTPLGVMHFPASGYQADFSTAPATARVWFIHEMVHVWQYQLGLCVAWHGAVLALKGGYGRGARAYAYAPGLDQGQPLAGFNIEQQADLIAHWFDARHLSPRADTLHARRVGLLAFYESVLADFFENPADIALLPRTTRVRRR